jgi:hypothetical protein
VWCPGQSKRIVSLPFFHGSQNASKILTVLTPKINCDQATIDMRNTADVTGVKPIAVCRRNIWDVSATPSRIKRKLYLCILIICEELCKIIIVAVVRLIDIFNINQMYSGLGLSVLQWCKALVKVGIANSWGLPFNWKSKMNKSDNSTYILIWL